MKQRFYLYCRGGTYYLQDSRTGKQQSLETKDRNMAVRLLEIKRQSTADPAYAQFILKSCLATRDPLLAQRTWTTVMEQIKTHGKSPAHRLPVGHRRFDAGALIWPGTVPPSRQCAPQ